MKHILVKISVNEECIFVRTVSREYRSSQRFIILIKELKALKEKGRVTVSDIYSFARLYLKQSPTGETLVEMDFTWLTDCGGEKLTGRREHIVLDYEKLLKGIEQSLSDDSSKDFSMLSLSERRKPEIKFCGGEHLKAVVQNKGLRRKLGKFLDRYFQWPDTKSIRVTDESIPYSFFFVEERLNGRGICGGIILHGQENLQKAYYEIHT